MFDNPIEEIKNRLDIVEVIQEYIQLKKTGANFRALCPFHSEKTPSFMVSQDKQIYHCFGCGEGGDIFGFIQKIEGVEFPEALRILAKKAGIELRRQDPALQNQKTKMMDICKLTSVYCHEVLLKSSQAQFVREYLSQRKVDSETIEQFKLGYAPDSFDALSIFLKNKGFSEDEIFLAGLSIKKERGVGYYDRFRNRLMFPINDVHGNTVGFGGRTLKEGEDAGAKYINSPQTLIYNKSGILYGLDQAKSAIRKNDQVILVEGYMDCITAHQFGINNVVASSGTALTEGQVRLLKRFCNTIIMSFDPDTAGAEAVKRGIEVALRQDVEVRVIELPTGKDPDVFIKADKDGFIKLIEEAKAYLQYYFDNTFKQLDLSKVEDKKKAAKILLPIIVKIVDTIERSYWLKELGKKLEVDDKIMQEKLRNLIQKENYHEVKEELLVAKPIDRFLKIGEELLSLLIIYPNEIKFTVKELVPEYFTDYKQKLLYKNIITYYTKNEQLNLAEFQKQLTEDPKEGLKLIAYSDILKLLGEENFLNLLDSEIRQKIEERLILLKKNSIQEQLKKIEQKIKKLEQNPSFANKKELDILSETFNQFTNQLNQL